jgi:hypothetical protein
MRSSVAKTTAKTSDTAANLGFEAKLWAAGNALRNSMDAAEYKHVVLGPDLPQVDFRRVRCQAHRALGAEGPRAPTLRIVKSTAPPAFSTWCAVESAARMLRETVLLV